MCNLFLIKQCFYYFGKNDESPLRRRLPTNIVCTVNNATKRTADKVPSFRVKVLKTFLEYLKSFRDLALDREVSRGLIRFIYKVSEDGQSHGFTVCFRVETTLMLQLLLLMMTTIMMMMMMIMLASRILLVS